MSDGWRIRFGRGEDVSFLRAIVDPAERCRVKAGIFFAGAYLVMQLAFGALHRPLPGPAQHDWLRVVSVLLLCFAMVLTGSLVVFDVALRRREIPRILRDLLQGIAYFITAAIVLTRDLKSSISGTENVVFAVPIPGAL